MGNSQALGLNDTIAKQHNVEIQRARTPALGFAYAPLLQFNPLGMIEQSLRRKVSVQRDRRVQVIRLILGT